MEYSLTQKGLAWLQGDNTLKINTPSDWKVAKQIMRDHGIFISKSTERLSSFYELAEMNNKRLGKCSYVESLYVEIQPGKGISYYTDVKESEEWYGKKPFTIIDIISKEEK